MDFNEESIKSLYLSSIQLECFRGFQNATIDFDKQLTVIAGINGAGKSSAIEAIALGLSRVAAQIQNPNAKGRGIQDRDVNNECNKTHILFELLYDDVTRVTWKISRRKSLRKRYISDRSPEGAAPDTRIIGLKEFISKVHTAFEENNDIFPIPVMAMYGANRAAIDIPLRIRTKHTFDAKEANVGALEPQTTHFRTFFEWFRSREDLENEMKLQSAWSLFPDIPLGPFSPPYIDAQLQAVRTVVQEFLGFENLRIRRSPLRMVLNKPSSLVEFNVNQLSDGERGLLALFGDVARRLAIASPGEPYPLHGKGIILIDEIDLHLHPRWQREVIRKLPKIFPNCQFIVSTHSPQILGEVDASKIRLLKMEDSGISISTPQFAKGLTTNLILTEIMDAQDRSKEAEDKLKYITTLIDSENYIEARMELEKLKRKLGSAEPRLVELNSLIDFLI